MRFATVAFPVIGGPVPAFPCPADVFLDQVVQRIPHWIYHVRIRQARKFASPFPDYPEESLARLARSLGLSKCYALRPREFVPGGVPKPGSSEYAFGYPINFPMDSAALAFALGLVAASTKRKIPNWVLGSGCLTGSFSDDLRLDLPKGEVERKVLLSFGRYPGYQLDPLLTALYEHPATRKRKYLGPRRKRVWPGRVRLLLLPTVTDTHPLEFVPPLAAVPVPASLNDFGQQDFKALRQQVAQLAGKDMLLVQVPTVWHALRLLGYHHEYFDIAARVSSESIQAFRVGHAGNGDVTLPVVNARLAAQQAVGELDGLLRYAQVDDLSSRLRVCLEHCCRLARCQSGDVAIVSQRPDWLRVVARFHDGPDLPPFVPRRPVLHFDVLDCNGTKSVENVAGEAEYEAARSPDNPMRERFGENDWEKYQELLRGIGAYVKVPLVRGGAVVGALYLHRSNHRPDAGPFHPRMLRLVEALAGRVQDEVARFLDKEEQALRQVTDLARPGHAEELARSVADLPLARARRRLGQGLAELACRRSGAYRVAVRLLCLDGKVLATIGFTSSGLATAADRRRQAPPLRVNDDSAAGHAVATGQGYPIPDASAGGVCLRPIEPRPRSHATLILRSGGHVLGTVSLDWDRPGACDGGLLAELDELARRFAHALRLRYTDEHSAQVDRLCAEAASRDGGGPDYYRFVWLVAQMLGGREAALLLRQPGTDRYELAASLRHRDWAVASHAVAPGPGLAGWVLANNRARRVADLGAALGLGSEVPELGWYAADLRPGRAWAALAVPVASGEVHGALLVLSDSDPFDAHDEQAALAAAARLANALPSRATAAVPRDYRQDRPSDPSSAAPHYSLEWLALECVAAAAAGPGPAVEPREAFLDAVGGSLVADLGARLAWLWLADGGGLRCDRVWPARDRIEVPELSLAGVQEELRARSSGAAGPVEVGPEVLAVLTARCGPALRAQLDGLRQRLIPVAPDGKLLALFFLALPADAVNDGDLQRLAGLLALAGRSTPHVYRGTWQEGAEADRGVV